MDNLEILTTLGTQEKGRRQKQNLNNTEN